MLGKKGEIERVREARKMAERWKGGSCAPPETEVWLCHCFRLHYTVGITIWTLVYTSLLSYADICGGSIGEGASSAISANGCRCRA